MRRPVVFLALGLPLALAGVQGCCDFCHQPSCPPARCTGPAAPGLPPAGVVPGGAPPVPVPFPQPQPSVPPPPSNTQPGQTPPRGRDG